MASRIDWKRMGTQLLFLGLCVAGFAHAFQSVWQDPLSLVILSLRGAAPQETEAIVLSSEIRSAVRHATKSQSRREGRKIHLRLQYDVPGKGMLISEDSEGRWLDDLTPTLRARLEKIPAPEDSTITVRLHPTVPSRFYLDGESLLPGGWFQAVLGGFSGFVILAAFLVGSLVFLGLFSHETFRGLRNSKGKPAP